MKKILSVVVTSVMILLSTLWVTKVFAADGGPVAMLESIADQMIAALQARKATLKTNPGVVYSIAYKIVVPHADLDEMSRRVLPPQVWQQATPAQRQQFKSEFTTLLVHTYASALAEYKDQTVKFYPARGSDGQGAVRVNSQIIRNDGPSISVSYRLISRGSQWKLIDMTVEGVSLLESFRAQFADKLSQGGNMTSLLKDLSAHNRGN
jgi:phospholipid transport system substrate-binding protein